MSVQNPRLGILLMVAATLVFSAQDGISRHLAGSYNVWMVVMIRYWFFAGFVVVLAARAPGGLRTAAATGHPALQVARGVLLVLQICTMVSAFVLLGLIEAHAVFASCPLMVAALSGPVLGERVGWRRWTAIAAGFVGILVILQPGLRAVSPVALVPLLGALLFALYVLLTRYVSRNDSAATSFFWTGTAGAVAMTAIGAWFWEPMTAPDWAWMVTLCGTGTLGHWLLIRAYAVAEASAIQPLAYLQLVFSAMIGISLFDETLTWNIAAGALIVVSAGLFTIWRERVRARSQGRSAAPSSP